MPPNLDLFLNKAAAAEGTVSEAPSTVTTVCHLALARPFAWTFAAAAAACGCGLRQCGLPIAVGGGFGARFAAVARYLLAT